MRPITREALKFHFFSGSPLPPGQGKVAGLHFAFFLKGRWGKGIFLSPTHPLTTSPKRAYCISQLIHRTKACSSPSTLPTAWRSTNRSSARWSSPSPPEPCKPGTGALGPRAGPRAGDQSQHGGAGLSAIAGRRRLAKRSRHRPGGGRRGLPPLPGRAAETAPLPYPAGPCGSTTEPARTAQLRSLVESELAAIEREEA